MSTSNTVTITEIPLDPKDPAKTAWGSLLSSQDYFAIANGGAAGETFNAADIGAATAALMATYGRGVVANMGAGDDTVVGSAYGDSITGGDGTNRIDGGDNQGTTAAGSPARDVLNVFAASRAAADALSVSALSASATGADQDAYAAGYRIKVTNGTETDYLKNVEQVNVFVATGSNGYAYDKSINLAVRVTELAATSEPGGYSHVVWAQGTAFGDNFDASVNVSAAGHAQMDKGQRGVWVDLGAGDDTVTGSAYGDDINVGSGTNYVDGGANDGFVAASGKAADVLRVNVASAAAAAAVQVTRLADGMAGLDAQAFANGYTHKVVAGAEIDYIKGIERVTVQVAQPNGSAAWARDIALVVDVREADLSNAAADSYANLAWVHGTAGSDVIDASGDTALLSAGLKTAMAARGRGVWVDGGDGNDTITGTAYADTFLNGAGNSKIDGGANAGPNGTKGADLFEVQVASAAEIGNVSVVPSDDPNYTWMVTYGAGSTQKDYLKNIESVVVYVPNSNAGKWIPLGVNVVEVNPSAQLDQYASFAWARGSVEDDHFSADADIFAATRALMDQHGRGVWVDLGAGNDVAVGSRYADDISVGRGTNYVDGGANEGSTPYGARPLDVLRVTVADQAAADAVQVTALGAGMSGADAQAYSDGYTYKVSAGGETDYIKNIELVTVQVGTSSSSATWARDIPLAVVVREAQLANPNTAGYSQLAWISGTAGADSIDASGDSALLSAALKNEMAASKRGVWIDGGAGSDTITGTDYADTFRNGAGNARIDGGANAGADGKLGMDVFEVSVASIAEMNAVQVVASDDPNYSWMVTYGAGITQKDYLKNVEAVNINVAGTSTGKWIPTGLNVYEIGAGADLDKSTWYATARGSALDESFNASTDISHATQALMQQHGRGVRVELGAGNNEVVGSAWGDDIVVVSDKSLNWVDGGANGGTPPAGGKASDNLIVMVDSQAAASAVEVTALTDSTLGGDGYAFAHGYEFKVRSGTSVSYVKGVEHVLVQVNPAAGGAFIARDIPLGIMVREVNVADPATASSTYQAWITGTTGNDVIDVSGDTALLSSQLKAAMPARGHGVYIDGRGGDDIITGTAYGDTFVNGPGNAKIDGGANAGPNGQLGADVFEVKVATVDQMNAVKVSRSDDPSYQWMVTYDSTNGQQKDYLKNVEGVRVTVDGGAQTKWFQTGLTITEVSPDFDPLHTNYYASVAGSALDETFNATTDISPATRALMDQKKHGIVVDMGAGNDVVVGSSHPDEITPGAGVNYVDGGDDYGTAGDATTAGTPGYDWIDVFVPSAAAADAVVITALTSAMTGADGDAYAHGYRFKVVNGPAETDYLKNVEQVAFIQWTDTDGDGNVGQFEQMWLRNVDLTATPAPTQAPTEAPTPAPTSAPTANTAPSFIGVPAGVAVSDAGSSFGALGGIVLASGKLLTLSYGQAAPELEKLLYLVRSNADGSIDTSFGNGTGRVQVSTPYERGVAPLEQADGKLVVAVSTAGSAGDFKLMRLNADGSVDASFGSNGAAVVSFGSGKDSLYALVAGADGKLVAVGATETASGSDLVVARFTSAGALDTTFNSSGKLVLHLAAGVNIANAVAVQPDGKLVVVGTEPGEFGRVHGVVLRLNSDGSLDSSFGSAGKLALAMTSGDVPASSVKLLADGKILVGGSYVDGVDVDGMVMRVNANGTLDTSFGTDGSGTVKLYYGEHDDYVVDTLTQADGKILVLSRTDNFPNSVVGGVAVTRLDAGGHLDTSFGVNGTTRVVAHGIEDQPASLALAGDKIVVFGAALNDSHANASNIIARLTAGGLLDASFGTANVSSLDKVVLADGEHPVALDPNATVFDAELAATSYAGATLTLQRQGGADASDHFVGVGDVHIGSGSVTVRGIQVGTTSLGIDGTLTITFNGQAGQGVVSEVMHGIGYTNSAFSLPQGPITIEWVFSDKNTGAQGTGGALTATGTSTVKVGVVVHETTVSQFDSTLSADHQPLAQMPYLAHVNGTRASDVFDSATGFSAEAKALMSQYQHGAYFDMVGNNDTVTGTDYGDEFSFGAGVNSVDGGAQQGTTNGHASRDVLDMFVNDVASANAVTAVRLTDKSTGADHDAFLAGYTVKVATLLNGEVDYLKNVEQVNIYGSSNNQLLRSIAIGMQIAEIAVSPSDPSKDASGQPLSASEHFAWVTGSDLADTFNASTDISAATRALMDSNARGVEVRAGAGDDTIVGSAWSDLFEGGAGVNYIDGGAKGSTTGPRPHDTLQVVVAPAAADAVRVTALTANMSDATDAAAFTAGYGWKVVAGSETDYVKNVEAVDILSWTDTNQDGVRDAAEVVTQREVVLGMIIDEVQVSSTDATRDVHGNLLADDPYFAWARGSAAGETFNAGTDISQPTSALMDQYGRGVDVSGGGGNDTITGSAHGDRISLGAGTNYVDGGDQAGSALHGAQARDTLDIYAAPADADAMKVVQLATGMSDATDAAAFAAGYTWKLMAGAEIDYAKNIEEVRVWSWTDSNHNGARDAGEVAFHHRLPFSLVIDEVNVSKSNPANTDGGTPLVQMPQLAWVYGTSGDDKFSVTGTQNAGGNISTATRGLMDQYKVGVSIDSGDGNDEIVGSAWADQFVLGKGVNKLDGGANGAGNSGGFAAEDVLRVFASSADEAAAVTVTKLNAGMGGDDGAAFAEGYVYKVQNGATETDYVKDVEKLDVSVWNDLNHDGQREDGEVTFARSVSLVPNTAPTFNGVPSGVSLTSAGYSLVPQGLAPLADGKMLALSLMDQTDGGGHYSFLLTRYLADGSLDTGFGAGSGSVALPVQAAPMNPFWVSSRPAQGSPVVLSDGSIMLAVSVAGDSGSRVALVHVTADGSVDTSFGTAGVALVPAISADTLAQVVVQADGRLVVGGTVSDGVSTSMQVARFNANGSLDTSFNGTGTINLPGAMGLSMLSSIALQGDGKLLVGGTVDNDGPAFGVTRLNANGTLDSSFGTGGTAKVTLSAVHDDWLNAVLSLGGGKVLVVGRTHVTGELSNDFGVGVARFNADGTLDATFGTQGKVWINAGKAYETGQFAAVQPDGKVLVAGHQQGKGAGGTLTVWRVNTDGSLDSTFGANGATTLDLEGGANRATGLALVGGKIVVLASAAAGFSDPHSGAALVRLNMDGSVDTSFSPAAPSTVGGMIVADGVHPAVLDFNASVYDAELSAAGNYGGASLTLARHGGAQAEDVFSFVGDLSADSGTLSLSGLPVATVSLVGGTLKLTFADGINQGVVNRVMHGIAYSNSGANPPSSLMIDWTFSDNDSAGALSAHGSTAVQVGVVEAPQIRSTYNPAFNVAGEALADHTYLVNVYGTARGDTFNATTALASATRAMLDEFKRGADIDTHGGGDVVTGTGYGDHIVLGLGVNYVDGGANAGTAPGGAAAQDVLEVFVKSQAEAAAVTTTTLGAQSTGADLAAFQAGYAFKVVAGEEIDYVKNVELLQVSIWDDRDHDGVRDYSTDATVNEVTPGVPHTLSGAVATLVGVPVS